MFDPVMAIAEGSSQVTRPAWQKQTNKQQLKFKLESKNPKA